MAEETKRVRVTVTDWVGMAKLTGEHHIRFPTNRRLEEFLAAAPAFIAPADAEQGHLSDLLAEVDRLRLVDKAFNEWMALSDWVQVEFTAGGFKGSAGRHRATIMREEIERLRAENEALRRGPAVPSSCGRCHDTGYTDFVHLGLDPCDHNSLPGDQGHD